MGLDSAFERVSHLLEQNPLTMTPEEGLSATAIADGARHPLERLRRTLMEVRARQGRPFRILVMGEVKAGKSSLINRLLGAPLCPTGVVETTRRVMVIRRGTSESATVRYAGGREERLTLQALHELLRGDSEIESVSVETPRVWPEVEIVDAPGLGTATAGIADAARSTSLGVDLVVWVWDAKRFGSSDIGEELHAVATLGKPLIIVANKIDAMNTTEAGRIRDFAAREYGDLYEAPAFTLSVTADSPGSQWGAFEAELRARIAGHSEAARGKSQDNTALAIAAQEAAIVGEVVRNAQAALTREEKVRAEMDAVRETLVGRGVSILEHRIAGELLGRELTQAQEIVRSTRFLRPEHDAEIRILFGTETVGAQWKAMVETTLQEVESLVRLQCRELATRLDGEAQTTRLSDMQQFEVVLGSLGAHGALLDSVTGSTAVAGAAAVGIAAYAAWLGPASAAVGFGAALGAIAPPVLIAGVLVGGVKAVLDARRRQDELITRLESLVSEARNAMMLQARGPFREALDADLRRVLGALADELTRRLFSPIGREEFSRASHRLGAYLDSVKALLRDSRFSGDLEIPRGTS